jgi:hypothetical protein
MRLQRPSILILAAALAAGCSINTTTVATNPRREVLSSQVQRSATGRTEPRIVLLPQGQNLLVRVRDQAICEESVLLTYRPITGTDTSCATEDDRLALTANWVGGVAGLLGGGIAVASAPSLSNESGTDSNGEKQASNRDAAYGLGAAALIFGGWALVKAIVQQGQLGVKETRAAPLTELSSPSEVPCGGGNGRPGLDVRVSGPSESALVGQTDARGELVVRFGALPAGVREEIANAGHLQVSVDAELPVTADWDVPSSLRSRMRSGPVALPAGPQPAAVGPSAGPETGGFTIGKCEVQDGQAGIAMGNGNGKIDPGEMVEILCRVKNERSDLKGELMLEPASSGRDVVLSSVKPLEVNGGWRLGEAKLVTFGLSVKKQSSMSVGESLPVIIRISRPGVRVLAEVKTNLHLGD